MVSNFGGKTAAGGGATRAEEATAAADDGPDVTVEVLYDFAGTEDAPDFQVAAGEMVILLEDHGEWVAVEKTDGSEDQGYIPSSYINKD